MTAGLLADFVRADRERGLGTYGISVQRDGEPPVEHRFRSDDRVKWAGSRCCWSVRAPGPTADS